MVWDKLVQFAAAANVKCGQTNEKLCETGLPVVGANAANVQNLLQVLFGILAVVSVVIITIAGLRFIIESTNPQETARARNTIVFAVLGLIIAISGQIIVSFVLDFAE